MTTPERHDCPLDTPDQWGTRRVRVRLRRARPDGSPWPVKPEAEPLDGRELDLQYGWVIEDDDGRYPGEVAWLLRSDEVARRASAGLPRPAAPATTAPPWSPLTWRG